MKIIFEKNELLKSLGVVGASVAPSTSPLSECISICAKDGVITILYVGADSFIKSDVQSAAIIEEGTVIIKYRLFCDIVKKVSSIIALETIDGKLQISSGTFQMNIPLCGEDVEYPSIPDKEEMKDKVEIKSFMFKKLISSVAPFVSTDEVRPALKGILLECRENSLNAVALDGYRLGKDTISIESNEGVNKDFLVDGKSLHSLVLKALSNDDEVIQLYFTDNFAIIKTTHLLFGVRLMNLEFIKYQSIIPNKDDFKETISLNTQKLREVISRVSILATDGKLIKITLEKDANELSFLSASSIGEVEETISTNSKIKHSLEIGFNPVYLDSALKATDEDTVAIYFNSAVSPALIIAGSAEYVILPVRIMRTANN